MTAAATSAPPVPTIDRDGPNWLAKRRLTRQLRLRDETSARLAELDNMADILNQAADLISEGWLQHSWFAYLDDNGRTKTVTAYNVNEMAGRPVVGACLVGAIVQAGGGLSKVRTQAVQRALDLTWNTLFETAPEPNHWTPAPVVRTQHVRDLTRWNDHPRRTAPQAVALLRRSAVAAVTEAADLSRSSSGVF
ncbi:MAG TPA: hypothetical protein VF086_04070 [Propionibacteriaceae bacterium]